MAHSGGLLTTKQLQELLQVDRITVYRMLQDGRLQGFKVGGQWRFSRQAIEQWLREQRGDLEAPQAAQAGNDLRPSTGVLPLSCLSAIQDIFAQALEV
ncbi:MAG TPA: DNA-binding protein, partial [Halothiobacillaceae bacterium]|nr:DNA-binding protein [Halothiobacillaceae bacterium]